MYIMHGSGGVYHLHPLDAPTLAGHSFPVAAAWAGAVAPAIQGPDFDFGSVDGEVESVDGLRRRRLSYPNSRPSKLQQYSLLQVRCISAADVERYRAATGRGYVAVGAGRVQV